MSGEYRISAPRARVWEALNDADILKQCIPGCESIEKISPTEFNAKVVAKVGPVKATFTGAVKLSDLVPPTSYKISGEGKGGAAGFAKGGAAVTLEEAGAETVLRYTAQGNVGGKLAQIGSRLIDGTAKKLADEFFGKLRGDRRRCSRSRRSRGGAAGRSRGRTLGAARAHHGPSARRVDRRRGAAHHPPPHHLCPLGKPSKPRRNSSPRTLTANHRAEHTRVNIRVNDARPRALGPPEMLLQGGDMTAVTVSMTVNGKPVTATVEARTLLVQLLRESLSLTGTHVGCDTSQCGACTVHVNGRSVKSCTILAVQAEGADITTIEGLAKDGKLHPMQEAFQENHGLQCGFCTPGMVMSALDLVKHNANPSEREVREWLEGNICRCTGYHNIVKSILAGAPP